MDDIPIMTNSKYELRNALKDIYQICIKLKVTIHQNNEKFYIGKTKNAVDFVAYHIKPGVLSLSQKTTKRLLKVLRIL